MSNLIFGVITLIFSSTLYFWSWRHQQRNSYGMAILLMVLAGLGLYFYVSADLFLHYWDERYHALVAKNFISHPLVPTLYENPVLPYDFRDWQVNHIWLHKQPLALWGMAGSMWLFGVNEIALRLPSIALVSVATYLIFSIGSYLFNKKTGYLAAFLFSINGLVIPLLGGRKATDHIDIFFMFFILLSIYLSVQYCRKENSLYSFLIGISIGLAILSKWLPALIVLPIWLFLVWDSEKFSLTTVVTNFVIIVFSLTLTFLPWQLYIFSVFPQEATWESDYNIHHLFQGVEGHAGSLFYYLNRIRINYGEYIYLPLAWFLWKSVQEASNKKRWAVLIWFWLPFLFFSIAKTKMQAYLLFTAPALFYMTAEFFYFIAGLRGRYRFKLVFNIILALILLLPIRYCVERLTVFEFMDRNPQWVIELRNLNKENFENGVLFNYDHPIEAMFYTNLTVYPGIPTNDVITNLNLQGYTVVVNDDGSIPNKIRENDQIVKVALTKKVAAQL
ncbi:MAG: ArnT family glycosyltransferase [Desulfocapsaceae bacterium]